MHEHERQTFMLLTTKLHFEKGDYIFQSGDPGKYVYILTQGRAKITQLSSAGKEMILWFCLPGEMFGLADLPRGGSREVSAQACSEAEVLAVKRESLNQFLMNSPNTSSQVIELLSYRMRVLGHVMMNLAADDVTSRIIKLILRLGARYPDCDSETQLDYPMTHQEMADMIGTSRQTVTSVLGQLRKKGVLSMDHHCIRIENQIELERLLNHAGNDSRWDSELH
jgi:CRP/FNR family transcriptional regulator